MNARDVMHMQRSISRFHQGLREALADNYIWGNYNVGDEIYNKIGEFMMDIEHTIKKWVPTYKEGTLVSQDAYNAFNMSLLEGRIKIPYGFNKLGLSISSFMQAHMPEAYESTKERLEFVQKVGIHSTAAESLCTNYTRLIYACPYMEKFIDKNGLTYKVSKKHIDGWKFERDQALIDRIENEINMLMLTRKFTATISNDFRTIQVFYEKGEK